MPDKKKLRLDQLLADQYGYASRSRARDAVLRGCVSVNGSIASKPGQLVDCDYVIQITDNAGNYVSRAALKLLAALEAGTVAIDGRICLDLGASTGGFCQVLLEAGAARVFAIDVGSGQLHASLRDHPRLVSIENLNVRDLTADDLAGYRPDVVTADLSFISLKLALPAALQLAADGAWGVFLIKPQFEVGRDGLGGGGIVRDGVMVSGVVEDLVAWLGKQPGWRVVQTLPSPISGGDGNKEFLMIACKNSRHD